MTGPTVTARPLGEVEIRLHGQPADVGTVLAALREALAVAGIRGPYRDRDRRAGRIRVYLTATPGRSR